jgi:serine/threonine-protein kinase
MPVSRASELVGRVVGGRYRLLRPVGSGASAHVYVAEDVRLKRRVALKLLHPALATDAAFLRRFQAEAQTVAVLRHQGIVRVYDWGEDAGNAYLTMELLEGGSLRSMLDSGRRLSVSQVAALALDVASALAYAHARGLVHRDVKPANLLFDEDGHVSVADFGIARALAEASWTEPLGAMLGTARYAAPEQLKGAPLDGRADVYSLAVVAVEAVTGDVPFSRDTALGALMARAEQPLPVPEGLGPLAPVLERAGTVSPEDRLSAEAFAQGIAIVARQLRAPTPLPLPGIAASSEGVFGREPTEIAGGRGRPRDAGITILVDDLEIVALAPGAAPPSARPPGIGPPDGGPVDSGPVDSGPVDGGPADGGRPDGGLRAAVPTGPAAGTTAPGPVAVTGALHGTGRSGRRRWLRRSLVAAVVVVLLGGAAGAAVELGRPAATYAVPRLGGEALGAASAALAADHLRLAVVDRQWDAAAKGSVITQYPPAGADLHANSAVGVTVSLGPEPVAVPDLLTLDVAQATSELRSDRLRLGRVARRTSMTVPDGSVISWSPRGKRVLPGTAVRLVVSEGRPVAVVPPLAPGTSFAALGAALRAADFKVAELTAYNDDVPAGDVVSVSPSAGTREVVGSTVTVTVSIGPHTVTIPAGIVGMSVDEAVKVLSRLGLYVYEVQGSPLSPVTGTQPAVGTAVLYGKSVVLVTR